VALRLTSTLCCFVVSRTGARCPRATNLETTVMLSMMCATCGWSRAWPRPSLRMACRPLATNTVRPYSDNLCVVHLIISCGSLQLRLVPWHARMNLALRVVLAVNLDDCWEAGSRAPDGSVQADPARFPGVRSTCAPQHACPCFVAFSRGHFPFFVYGLFLPVYVRDKRTTRD